MPRSSKQRVAVVVAAVLFLVLGASGYFARDAISTALANRIAEHSQGVRCSRLRLHLSSALDLVVIAPLECKLDALPISGFATSDPVTVTLRKLKPESVHIISASMTQRERDLSHVEMNALNELTTLTGATDEMVKSMLDACVMYQADMPSVTIDVLSPARGGKQQSKLYNFRKGLEGTQNRTQASRIGPADGVMTLADLDMLNTATSARARVDIYWGKRGVDDKPALRLALQAEHADTDHPRVKLSMR